MTIESAYGGELFKAPDKRERIGQGVLNHVLIIPDNNRTWAQRHGLSVREGYEVGARRMVEAGATAATVPGLDNLTIHVVSLDNILKRHPDELAHIWGAVQGQLFDPSNGLPQLVENGARIRVVGGLDGLDDGIPDYISAGFRELINGSVDKTGLNVSFVIGYDKDQEMEDALASAERAGQNPRRWHVVKQHFYLPQAGLPDTISAVIRTGEAERTSGVFPFAIAQAEILYDKDHTWPEFDEKAFRKAIANLSSRKVKGGG